MRVLAVAATAVLLAAAARAEIKEFKNWSIGCDNLLSCTAIGTAAEDGFPLGYVRVTRGGAGDAKPAVRLVVLSENGSAEGKAKMAVVLNGKPFGAGTFDATSDGTWTRLDLSDGDAVKFLFVAIKAN